MTKPDFPKNIEWKKLLDKYAPSTIKRAKAALRRGLQNKTLSTECLFSAWEESRHCYFCRAVFSEMPKKDMCPCGYYREKDVLEFARQVAKELGLLEGE